MSLGQTLTRGVAAVPPVPALLYKIPAQTSTIIFLKTKQFCSWRPIFRAIFTQRAYTYPCSCRGLPLLCIKSNSGLKNHFFYRSWQYCPWGAISTLGPDAKVVVWSIAGICNLNKVLYTLVQLSVVLIYFCVLNGFSYIRIWVCVT